MINIIWLVVVFPVIGFIYNYLINNREGFLFFLGMLSMLMIFLVLSFLGGSSK